MQYLDGPIRCEKSVELRIWKAFLIPALAICRVLEEGGIPGHTRRYPYISPPIQAGRAITDFQVVDAELPNEGIALRAEVKCPPVLLMRYAQVDDEADPRPPGDARHGQYSGFWHSNMAGENRPSADQHLFDELQEYTESFRPGDAIRFTWPTASGSYQTKLTKVLMQASQTISVNAIEGY